VKRPAQERQALTCLAGEPRASYHNWRAELQPDEDALLLVDFTLAQYWLPGTPGLELTAIYCRSGGGLQTAVTDQPLIADGSPVDLQFERWLDQHGLLSVGDGEPLPLVAEHIAKPWGQEIWFTGVEERGVCRFGDQFNSVPIPWLQAVLPSAAYGAPEQALVLLKILDPAPSPVVGDLYFELHEEKREIYVVTHVDEGAWPGGRGGIRFGFDRQRLAQYPDEEKFRQAYLAAVKAYEAVRRELDALPTEPPAKLLAREEQLRAAMNSFTHLRELAVGDVVVVPLLTPHSLQHGVRTIEFQTPVYERKILSFAQQVLTQDHWDTESAVRQMRLEPPPEEPFTVLREEPGIRVERIVDFPDFEVRRVRLEPGAVLVLESLVHYGLIMVVSGALELDGLQFGPEQAVLLPRHWEGQVAPLSSEPEPASPLVLLLAEPRL
jgi:hypothetical protein